MGEIATWSAVKTKVGLGKDSNECLPRLNCWHSLLQEQEKLRWLGNIQCQFLWK